MSDDKYDPVEAEFNRAKWCIEINPDKTLEWIVSHYMIRPEVAKQLGDVHRQVATGPVIKKTRRTTKWATLQQYLQQHVGDTVHLRDMAVACSMSVSSMRRFAKRNPQIFEDAGRSKYTIKTATSSKFHISKNTFIKIGETQ